MNAQVKADFYLSVVTAFGGHEYVKYESRPVPAGREEEATSHPFLDVVYDASKTVSGTVADPLQLESTSGTAVNDTNSFTSTPIPSVSESVESDLPLDLSALSATALKKLAKEAGIKGWGSMKKADLITALEGDA